MGFPVPFGGAAAGRAAMRLHVVACKVFFEKVYGGTEIALEHLRTLLIRFFVALPVGLFDKGLLAAGAEVPVLFTACPGLLVR